MKIRPEEQFLLLCTSRHMTGDTKQRIAELLEHGLNTNYILDMAKQHGIRALLYRGLLRLDLHHSDIQTLIQQLREPIANQGIAYEFAYPGQLAKIVRAMNKAGINVLLLKGYALATQIYGQAGLRPYGDFDLMISPGDIDKTEDVIESLGFEPDEWYQSRGWYRKNHHHLAPYQQQGWLQVEVHHKLLEPEINAIHGITFEDLWDDSQVIVVDGIPARTLCMEHLFIYLCLHASSSHLFTTGLKAIRDIAEAVEVHHDTIDWDKLTADAEKWHCMPKIVFAVCVAGELFGVALPDALPREEMAFSRKFLDYAIENVVAADETDLELYSVWREKSLSRVITLLQDRLFPHPASIATYYALEAGSWRVWLYYPVWLLRKAWRVVEQAFSIMRGSRDDPLSPVSKEATRQELIQWLNTPSP